MFSAIIEQVTKLIGQAYLISGLAPWMIFWTANSVTLLAIVGPRSAVRMWEREIGSSTAALTAVGFLGLLFLVVGAMLVVSLNGLFRRVLEGRYHGTPFGPFFDLSRIYRARKVARLRRRSEKLLAELGGFIALNDSLRGPFAQTYNAARSANPPRPDAGDDLFASVEASLKTSLRKHDVASLQSVRDRLAEQYAVVNPARFDDLHAELLAQASDREERVLARVNQIERLRRDSFLSVTRVTPTLFGHAVESANAYVLDRYGIESLVFWSRLQKVIPKEYLALLEDAKILMDFLTALTMFGAIYAIGWFFILPHVVSNPWTVVLVPAGGLIGTLVFYKAAVEAAYSFAELLRSSFDLFRRDLLAALSLPQPNTLALERDLWSRLSRWAVFNDPPNPDLQFEAPEEAAAKTGGGNA